MIDVTKLTQDEITRLGIDTLALALGPAGMARFMQQFTIGRGDYTRDRDKILGNPTIEEIVARIKQRRQSQEKSPDLLPKFTSMKMIDVTKLTPAQIRQMGIEALTKVLGNDGMTRFMQQLEMGTGDYTTDRDQILGNISNEEIIASIEKRRQQQDKEM